ncbi:MAG: rane protein [Fibrobacteria bacterium]|jgi:glucose/arabinose dehydrogenase|nr:rane protein [Fibrobacteria bacterium]
MRTLLKLSIFAALLLARPVFPATVPATVHPNWTKIELRPAGFQPQVSGMGFLSDGRLAVAHWDTVRSRGNNVTETVRAFSGKVYVLSGVLGPTPAVSMDTIARGLEDIMGLAVVNDTLYVSGGNTIIRLNRAGNTGPVTRVDTVFILPGTPAEGSSDSLKPRHGSQEYLNGLLHRNGKLYVSPSSLDPIGSVQGSPQANPHRGTLLEVTPGNGTTDKRGAFRIVANGIRAASGLGFGPDGLPCVPDNQGDWLPGNKLICVQEGKFYGAKKSGGLAAAYYAPWDNLTETPPTVWAVHNDIANSPTAPLYMTFGPYAGQMLMGDVRWGGIQRYFLEKNAQGGLQGAAFVFTGGLEAGVFRMAIGPDSMLYVGMIGGRNDNDGFPKSQTTTTRVDFGLVKLRFMGGDPAFEMLAVRSRPTGFEIEFTKPVDTAVAKLASSYTVQSYHMTPNSTYGGGSKLGSKTLVPKSILFSPDRRKVFLALDSLVPSTPTQMRVVQIRLNNYKSSTGDNPWNTETWYTLNALGTGTPFDLPVALRTPLSESPAAGEVRWIVGQGNLHVRTPAAARAIVRLRGVNGALLAELSPSGTGEHTLALGAVPARFAILEVTGEGFRLRRLIDLR